MPRGRILPILGKQFLTGTGLRNVPVCYHQDLIRILDDENDGYLHS